MHGALPPDHLKAIQLYTTKINFLCDNIVQRAFNNMVLRTKKAPPI